MSNFGKRFGALIARKREDKGWSFAELAVAAYGDDGQGGETRKSDVQKLEIGGSAKPTARTIKRYRDALGLTQEEIDACRTPEELQLAQYAEALFDVIKGAVAQTEVSDDLAHELSERYAAGNPEDFEGAVRGLMRALEIAAKRQTTGNLDADVNAIIAEVKRLNEEGQLEDAARALDEALESELAEEERRAAGIEALIREGIDQAILMRDVERAAALLVRQVDRETPDPTHRFEGIRAAQEDWYVRGRDQGLAFDLEVSIAVAEICLVRASDADERGSALIDLGVSLQTLGARESATAQLEDAVAAYRAALEECTRERVPLGWAMTQNNLGNALWTLGERESGTARLEEAVATYRAALEERTRERVPLDWAMTQNNLGNALRSLGARESRTARLEEAVAAFRAALEERTRDRVPLDWAVTQNNLGTALFTLGARESGTTQLEEAVAAYRAALEERTRERVPFHWAITTQNIGLVFESLFEKTEERAQLEEAIALVRAAREVFDEAGASFYIENSDRILARLEAKL